MLQQPDSQSEIDRGEHAIPVVRPAAAAAQEVLQGRKETLGDNHPHTLGAMSLLNSLLEQQGKRP